MRARARPSTVAPRDAQRPESASDASRAAASRRSAAVRDAEDQLLQLACSAACPDDLRPLLRVGAATSARTQRFAVRVLLRLWATDRAIGATRATAAATLHQLVGLVADTVRPSCR